MEIMFDKNNHKVLKENYQGEELKTRGNQLYYAFEGKRVAVLSKETKWMHSIALERLQLKVWKYIVSVRISNY